MATPTTTEGTTTLDLRLADLGADCEHRSCPDCRRVLLGRTSCSCTVPEPSGRIGRLHNTLLERVDVGFGDLEVDLERLTQRGELLA